MKPSHRIKWPRLTKGCAPAALALCLLTPLERATTPTPDAAPAGRRSYQSLLSDTMQALGDDASAPEVRVAVPMKGESRRAKGIYRQAEMLGQTTPLDGIGIIAGLQLWVAERVIEQEGKSLLLHNYQQVTAWRAQLPERSAGRDVAMLADKETGELVACFTSEFWKGHRDVIRAAYPQDRYEYKVESEPYINYTHLPPLDEPRRPTEEQRQGLRKSFGPVVDTLDDFVDQTWAHPLSPPPPAPQAEAERGPGMTNPYPDGPKPKDSVDLRYTRGMMERDLKGMRALAQAILAYEEARRAAGGSGEVGGVALEGGVRFPAGATPAALYAARGRLYARAGGRDLLVDGVDPAEFAVFLRGTVLAGRAPQISIGTEPSGRAGYQRVSYSGGIRNTAVGEALLRADLKLKGVLAGIGMGAGGRKVGRTQEFLWSFPDPAGLRWVRLWLTGGEASMSLDGGRLYAATPRMRLNYELGVRDRAVRDPEVDRFVEEFNQRWPEVAADVPEFRRLEGLALAAALAHWVADSECVVSPELWVVPFARGRTPEYVPAYLGVAGPGLIGSGGVSLHGEGGPRPSLGAVLAYAAARVVPDAEEDPAGSAGLAALVFVGLLASGLLPALFIRRALPVLRRRRLFALSLKIWVSALALLWLADAAVSAPAGGLLGPFDSEFLCLLALLALPLALLHLLIRRELRRAGGGRLSGAAVWLGLPAAGLCAALALAALAAAANLLLLSGGGVSAWRLRAANVLAAPLEVAARPWMAQSREGLHLLPESLSLATRYRFYLPAEGEGFDARGLVLGQWMESLTGEGHATTLPSPDSSFGPPGSPLALRVVRGPGFTSKRMVLSVTGEPPY